MSHTIHLSSGELLIRDNLRNLPNGDGLPLITKREPSQLRIVLESLDAYLGCARQHFHSSNDAHTLCRERGWLLALPIRLFLQLVQQCCKGDLLDSGVDM